MGMSAKKLILSRLLPKTGQSVFYRTGCDGDLQKGWWKGRLLANNKTRFVSKCIGGDDVVIDRATGLIWAADGNAAGCGNGTENTWPYVVDSLYNLSFAGFNDWRCPNIRELASIIDYSLSQPTIDGAFFPNTKLSCYWTSTSWAIITTLAWYVNFDAGVINTQDKTASSFYRAVRGG